MVLVVVTVVMVPVVVAVAVEVAPEAEAARHIRAQQSVDRSPSASQFPFTSILVNGELVTD